MSALPLKADSFYHLVTRLLMTQSGHSDIHRLFDPYAFRDNRWKPDTAPAAMTFFTQIIEYFLMEAQLFYNRFIFGYR